MTISQHDKVPYTKCDYIYDQAVSRLSYKATFPLSGMTQSCIKLWQCYEWYVTVTFL